MSRYIIFFLLGVIIILISIPISALDKAEDISLSDVKFKEVKIIPTSESIYSFIPDSEINELGKIAFTPDDNMIAYGFSDAEKTIHQKFFAIGNLYANLLTKLSGKYDKDEVIGMVKALQDGLDNLGASNAIFTYLFNLENMIASDAYQYDILRRFLTMLYPFIEEFSESLGAKISLQAGHWLVDLAIISAAKNEVLIKQSDTALFFADEYEKLNAPKGVIKSFKEIAQITSKSSLSIEDYDNIITLSENIRGFLR